MDYIQKVKYLDSPDQTVFLRPLSACPHPLHGHHDKTINLALAIMIIIFSILTAGAGAATYYLDAVKGDDTNGDGTGLLPWRTLAKAQTVAVEGDIVRLRDGHYGAFIEIDRTTSRTGWITYMADDNCNPVLPYITLSNELYGESRDYYLKFDGLTIQAPTPDPLPPDDGYWHTDSNRLVQIYKADHVTVQNCTMFGWNKYCSSGAKVYRSSYVSFLNNEQHTTGAGIQAEGTHYLTIRGNYIHNMGEGSGLRIIDNPLTGEPSTHTVWEDNHLYDMGGSASADDPYFPWQPDVNPDYHQGSFFAIKSPNVTMRRNIAHYGGSQGIYFYGGNTYSKMVIENNLIYDTGGRVDFDPDPNRTDYRTYTGRSTLQLIDGSCKIRNNTFIGDIIMSGTDKYDILSRYAADVFEVSFADGFDGTGVEIYNNIVVGQWGLPDPLNPNVNKYSEDNNLFWGQSGNSGTTNKLGAHTRFAVWNDGDLCGWPNMFEDIGFTGTTDQYDYAAEGVQPFFINPGFQFSKAHDYRDHGKTFDYRLYENSPAVNIGNSAHQPSDSLGTLGPDGFIRTDGVTRDTSHHSVGCYEYAKHVFEGLVGYWKFDETKGTLTEDSSEYGNAGNLVGPTRVRGGLTNTLRFDGVNDYVDCGTSDSFNLKGSLSVSVWINPRTFGQRGWGRIVDRGDGTCGYSIFIDNTNRAVAYVVYGGQIVNSQPDVITLDRWQHICVVYDHIAQTLTFYRNGSVIGQTPYSNAPTDSSGKPLVIGIRGYDENRAFDGMIDDVRIYNRALDQARIRELHNRTRRLRERSGLTADVFPEKGDGIVNFHDWATFLRAWQSTPYALAWNPMCDIWPEEGDDIVNQNDIAVFMRQWLQLNYYTADVAPGNGDGRVDFRDWAAFARAYPANSNDGNWNPKCDIMPEGGNGIIDADDLEAFMGQWLLAGTYAADIAGDTPDRQVNMKDWAALAAAWQSNANDDNWNLKCDLAPGGGDGTVDIDDLIAFCKDWLMGNDSSSQH